jgi:hypothetical protein
VGAFEGGRGVVRSLRDRRISEIILDNLLMKQADGVKILSGQTEPKRIGKAVQHTHHYRFLSPVCNVDVCLSFAQRKTAEAFQG